MFVRKKKNRSGSVSIVVVDKSRGRFREVRQFGVAHTEAEADALYTQAREWIRRYAGQQTIDFGGGAVASENEVDMLSAVLTECPSMAHSLFLTVFMTV